MLLLDAAAAPAPPLPAGAPWWAWLLLALVGILVPAIVQVFLARRRTASLGKVAKDLAALAKDLAALKARVEEGQEKTDPVISTGREQRLQKIEERLALAERGLGEERTALERLTDWKDTHLQEERGRRERAKAAAMAREAADAAKIAEVTGSIKVLSTKLDGLLEMVGGFFGLGKAIHGRNADRP